MIHSSTISKNDFNQVTSNPYANWQKQSFSFPYLIIDYISKTIDYRIYQKLTKICKYFQAKEKKILVKQLCFMGFLNVGEARYINISASNNNISNLWITNALICDGMPPLPNHNSIQKLTQKIYKCDAKSINLWYQNFTLNDFNFLVNPNFVEQFKTTSSKILKPDGNSSLLLVVEEIIEKIPNAKIIDLYDIPFTSKTSQNLLALNHKVKIQGFSLYAVPHDFDTPSYCKFIDKNSAHQCHFWMNYKTNNQEIIDSTSEALKNLHESWDESRHKVSKLVCC